MSQTDSIRTPRVHVAFDHIDRRYEPGDPITLKCTVDGLRDEELRALELSLAWYTEGKGEEDLCVVSFERRTDPGQLPPAARVVPFATRLPSSPLSYEGVIVKIRWCVRVRLFFAAGREYVSEHVFDVGGLPPARPLVREAS